MKKKRRKASVPEKIRALLAGWPVPLSKQLDRFWPYVMLKCVSPSAEVMKGCELCSSRPNGFFFFKPKPFHFDEQEDSLSTAA